MKIIKKILRSIGDILKLIIFVIADLILRILRLIIDKFQELALSEKIIFLNTILAFFVIILPVAKFYIFEKYFFVNNPLAVYMIGIVIIMIVSLYFTGMVKLVIRVVLNSYYLFWVIYLPLAGELTKADPFEICFGYYLNIVVAAIYISSSFISYFYYYE